MIEFLKSEYNISDIPIKEITVTHIENFYLYLREQCEVSNNTAMKFVQRFHTILLFAQKSGLSFLDPFNNFRFNFDKTDRGYLTQEEIDTIYHKEFQSKRLEQVRDAFIFSCFTFLALIHNQLIMNYLKQATIEVGNDLETTQVHRFA